MYFMCHVREQNFFYIGKLTFDVHNKLVQACDVILRN